MYFINGTSSRKYLANIIVYCTFLLVLTSLYSRGYAKNCDIYRNGKVLSTDLQVFSDRNRFEIVKIRYRPEYNASLVPLCVLDERCTAALFNFDIKSGKSIAIYDREYMRNVYEYTHASLLIDSHAWFPLSRRLPTYARRPAGASFEGYEPAFPG